MKLRLPLCRPVVRHLPSEPLLVLSARATYSYLANDKSSHPIHPTWLRFIFFLRYSCSLCEALGDSVKHAGVLNVVFVICLELGGDAGESALEGVLGGGVNHFGLSQR